MARLGIEGLKRKLSELQGVIDEAADDKLRGDHHLKLCKLSRALHEGVSALPSTATGVGAPDVDASDSPNRPLADDDVIELVRPEELRHTRSPGTTAPHRPASSGRRVAFRADRRR